MREITYIQEHLIDFLKSAILGLREEEIAEDNERNSGSSKYEANFRSHIGICGTNQIWYAANDS